MGSLRRAKRDSKDRAWVYALLRKTLVSKGLMDAWLLNDLCGIGVNKLRDNKGPSGLGIRLRIWSWSNKDVVDLVRESKGIKEGIFFRWFDAMMPMRLLANGKPRIRIDLWASAWDISRSHHRNFMKFGGLLEDTPTQLWARDQILLIAKSWEKWCPRWPMEARARKRGEVERNSLWKWSPMEGSVPYPLGKMESRWNLWFRRTTPN